MTVTLRAEALADLLARGFVANRMSPGNARILAGVVAAAERDEAHSHGLFRMPGYIATLQSGWVDGAARPSVADAAPGVVATDAMNGFTQVALAASRDLLQDKARHAGIATLAIRNSHHFAALWPDVEPFAEAGFVALAFVNSRPRMAPFRAKRALLGTNPMAFACPRGGALPMVWDQASSVTAMGEVLLAAKAGLAIPEGLVVDAAGRPTTDPNSILQGGAMLPFAEHKGSAIALMVEILAASLTGGQFGYEDRGAAIPGAETTNAGELIILIDPRHFAGAGFGGRLEEVFAHLSEGGVDRLPADRRHAARAKAERVGIPVSRPTYDYLCSLLPPSDPEHRRDT